MRSAGVKAAISCDSQRFHLLIERTSTEAVEQTPALHGVTHAFRAREGYPLFPRSRTTC
jgi:hypothetical protein